TSSLARTGCERTRPVAASRERVGRMTLGLWITIIVVLLIAGAAFVLAMRRRNENVRQARRSEASEQRDLARATQLEADRLTAEAEERAARSKREQLAGEQRRIAA